MNLAKISANGQILSLIHISLELDSDGCDRQEACCVFHADQSSLRPFLTSLERFLRDHGAGTSLI